MFYIDLDEIDIVSRALKFFMVDKGLLYNFKDSDYLPETGGSLIERVKFFAKGAGIVADIAHVRILTTVRFLNYVFNPISLFFCFDQAFQPVCTVAEVGNTFNERKPFVLPVNAQGWSTSLANKHFYVSPFSPLNLYFRFLTNEPKAELFLSILSEGETGVVLAASVKGKRLELNDKNLLNLTLKYPLVTLRTITLIHMHALLLWWKGVPFFHKSENMHQQTGVLNRYGKSTRQSGGERFE